MNLSERLESIELKIRQLTLKMRQIKRTNEELAQENHQLQLELSRKDATIAQLQQALEKAGDHIQLQKKAELEKAQQLKVQVDQYIREIDKCIEWLTNN